MPAGASVSGTSSEPALQCNDEKSVAASGVASTSRLRGGRAQRASRWPRGHHGQIAPQGVKETFRSPIRPLLPGRSRDYAWFQGLAGCASSAPGYLPALLRSEDTLATTYLTPSR